MSALARRGFARLTLVVGYLREKFVGHFGSNFQGIDVEYVINENYAETERGYSLYLARESWRAERRPVLFMDADNLFHPAMLDGVMECGFDDVMLVDERLETPDRDEELVRGGGSIVSGLYRGRTQDRPDCVGGFVGINRFSAESMGGLFDYMDQMLAEGETIGTYESVFDAFIKERGWRVNFVVTKGLPWINVNHESDYEIAKQIARKMKGGEKA